MTYNTIYNDDCFNVFDKLDKNSIDMVLVDLPYGQTAFKWDIKIDLSLMWEKLNRICKSNCLYVFFTTTKFGNELINSNRDGFRYDLVWEKNIAVGFLSSNKMPLRKHEMIYIFTNGKDDNRRFLYNGLREYSQLIKNYINRPLNEIENKLGYYGLCHFYSKKGAKQFYLPSEKTYNFLINEYKINEMPGFRTLDDLRKEKKDELNCKDKNVYNPQMTEGTPYTKNENVIHKSAYGNNVLNTFIKNKGVRYPTSILKANRPTNSIHPTQKPLELCEWLIKTYSNKGDLVLDFCMGSGSSIVSCINTERQYIGIEKDPDIFKTAKNRINKIKETL